MSENELTDEQKEVLDRLDSDIRWGLAHGVEPSFMLASLTALSEQLSDTVVDELLADLLADPEETLRDELNKASEGRSVVVDPQNLTDEERAAMETLGVEPDADETVTGLTLEDPTEDEKDALRTLGLEVE